MKCKIIDGKRTCRKSYNPFKMWGSWIGAGIMLLNWYLKIFPDKLIPQGCISSTVIGQTWWYVCSLTSHDMAVGLFSILGSVIIGFFLGYGIHALIRRYSK
jgi:hypothetical protein